MALHAAESAGRWRDGEEVAAHRDMTRLTLAIDYAVRSNRSTSDSETGLMSGGAMSDERELLSELSHTRENSRLSCQVEFTEGLAGLRVEIAPDE